MSWRDPSRLDESAEDQALRSEMRELLGLPGEGPLFETDPTPELIQLAERLRTEASRRRRTARQRPVWLLMAAGLPFLLALGALGTWGLQHKRRADQLAAERSLQQEAATRAAAASQDRVRSRDREGAANAPTAEALTPPADAGHPARGLRPEAPTEPLAAERLQAMKAAPEADPASPSAGSRRGKAPRARKPGELVIPAVPVDPRLAQPTFQVKQKPQ